MRRHVILHTVLTTLLALSAPTLASAQSTITVDAYLHGSGGTANPPTLTADLLPSISLTTKTKDSASLAFSGGNAWKVIGNWVPPAGSSASIKLNAFTTSHLWLGLKASADVGGKVDLRAEILVNGQVLSSGMTRCLSTLTASASTPQDIATTLSAIPVTTVNPASDTLAIRYSARMGTNTNGTACGTKTSVTGVRAYFDSLTRLSRVGVTLQLPPPTPVALVPNPRTIHADAIGTLTAILFPAPLQAGTLTLMSSNTAVATVPASVPVGTLQFLVPITVTGVSAGTTVITATMNGKSTMSTVRVVGGVATVTSLTPPAMSITQGGTGTLTVTINAVQSTNTVVSLASSAASVASVPATVTVPAGQTTAPIPVAANTVGQADIIASLNGTTATSHITVTPVLPTVVSLLPPTSQVTIGASGTLTVTISAAHATNTTVTLAASPANIVTLPPNVIVPANQTTATFPVTGVALGTAMITASLNSSSVQAAVDVVPAAVQLTDLQPPTQNLVVGAIGTLTVSLNAQQTSPTIITLTNAAPTVLQVPPTVTVQPGQTQANFTVTALTTGTATITATLGSVTKQATVVVIPQPPSVVSLLPSALPVVQGATGTLTLTINAAQQTDTSVPLTNSAPSIVDVPPSATVPAGQTTVAIPVAGLTVGTATVTATLNGTAPATVQVVPPPVTITALGPVPPIAPPLTLAKGRAGVLRVTVNRVSTDPTVVSLSNSATSLVTVPPTVTVPAGALFADFPVTTQNESTATITATLNSTSATAQVVVIAPEVDALTLSPLTPNVFATEPVQFTATATMTDGTTQPLTTGITWTSTNTTVATIDSTGLATTLTAGTTTIKAATTNSLGPVIGETLLTVQPAPALTLTPTVTTLLVGQATTLTITSAAPAPTGGLVVTLTQTGTGSVTVVGSATIPATQSTVQVVVSGATPGLVTVTGTAVGRTPGSTQFTINLPPPTITGFTPATGLIGTVVTITGTNFTVSGVGTTTVKFNGKAAIITTLTATSMTTTVPQGATNGSITVTTPGGTATSATPFTVALSADFQIVGAPGTVTAVQSRAGTAVLSLTRSAGFANLVNLTATGLPPGVTATFSAPVVTLFQPVTLTLTTSAATPVGTIPVTVTGSTTIDGQPIARAAIVNLSVLAAGNTSFSGRVLREQDATPLVGVTLRLGTLTAVTDATGRFFFASAPAGTQIMTIDGSTVAAPPGTAYSTLPVQVTLLANQHNELPFVSYLPAVDITVFSVLDPTRDSVISTPNAPGLRVTIPAGVELRSDVDGSLITKVSVQPVSPDRIPVPPPSDPTVHVDPVTIYRFYFHKPGGAIPSQPISNFAIPNDAGLPPGSDMLVYYFDGGSTVTPGSNQWRVAGTGTVTADGTQVVPNPGTAIPKLCCPLIYVCPAMTDEFTSPNLGSDNTPDPVNLATGQFILRKTDLILPGRIPISITRLYQSGRKQLAGPFGRGTNFVYERQLLGPVGNGVLYQQGNGRIDLLSRQSDGTYQNLSLPPLRSLVLTLGTTAESIIRRKDGSIERYDGSGRLVGMVNRAGSSLTISRDPLGQISTITNAPDRTLLFQYDAAGHITSITDPLGRTVQYTYTTASFLETVTDPAGGVTRYSYDVTGNLLSVRDPHGITYVTNQYDVKDRVVQQTMGDGGVYRFQYTMFGDTITETKVIDPRGNTTTNRFSPQRFTARATNALGLAIARTFDLKNQVTETRDPQDRVTKYTYDEAGNVTSMTDPNNNVTRLEYEPTFNRLTKMTDALNQATTFSYDAQGNLLTISDPLSHAATVTYNPFGQLLTVTDALNNTTTFTYDVAGNLLTTTNPLGNTTTRTYDLANRLIARTGARGFTTQLQYDALNRVTQINDPMTGVTRFTYDPNGNLLTVTDANNHVTTFTYDSMDRLTSKADALGRQELFTYDLTGNLTQHRDRKNQVTTVQYDSLNRRIGSQYADGSSNGSVYDSVGRLVRATDSVTGSVEFTYDSLNRMVKEVSPQGIVDYQYDALGRRTSVVANGSQPASYQYDAASRLTRVERGAVFAALGYDNANRRTSLSYTNGAVTTYSYDAASRLTNIANNGPTGLIEALTYTYDAGGNRVSIMRSNGPASVLPQAVQAVYDEANQQIRFGSPINNLEYDANGNLEREKDASGAVVRTYTWDARNRLVGIGGNASANFSYDPLGRRAEKTTNSVSTKYLYDGDNVAAEIGNGTVQASYLRSKLLDEPFVRQVGGATEYYHQDAQGTSLALSNGAGSSAITYSYEPFGKAASTGTSSNTFQYTGRENDGTGLMYYRARYYSPILQRFISEDPLGLGGGVNAYSYARNNPVRFVDPDGLFSGGNHKKIARRALQAEGCSDDFTDKAVGADYDSDHDPKHPTLEPEWANRHGQLTGKGQSIDQALANCGQYVNEQLAAASPQGLGRAMHSVEDPYSRSHGWTPALPAPWTNPLYLPDWIDHMIADFFPGDEEVNNAVEADIQLIRKWKDLMRKKGKDDSCQ